MKIVSFQNANLGAYLRSLPFVNGWSNIEDGVEVRRLSPSKHLRSNTDGGGVLWASSVIFPAIRGI
jgi:hypothetical protein